MSSLCRLSQYKLYIFDFDYTLFDTSEGQIQCTRAAMEASGLAQISEQAIRQGMGIPLRQFFGNYTSEPRLIQLMERAFLRRLAELKAELAQPLTSTISVVNELHARGSKLAICTGQYRDRVSNILTKYSIDEAFDLLVCCDEITKGKPDPEGLMKCLAHFKDIGKNQIAYVGDHRYDIMAARECGIVPIAVTSGTTPRSELTKYEPTFVIDDLIELLE